MSLGAKAQQFLSLSMSGLKPGPISEAKTTNVRGKDKQVPALGVDGLVGGFGDWGVGFAEFVLVVLHEAAGDLDGEGTEVGVGAGGVYDAAEGFEAVDGDVFGPDVEAVAAGRDAVHGQAAVGCGDAVVGGAEGDDDGAHLGVDVAEDVGDTFAVEDDGALGVGFVEAEVEALAVEEGEDVVEEGVEVGELDAGAGGDDQDVRGELLILLDQGVLLVGARREGKLLGGGEPDDDVSGGGLGMVWLALRAGDLHMKGDGLRPCGLWPSERGEGQSAQDGGKAEA
jgi:hypothetical protein